MIDMLAIDIETVPLASSMALPYPEDERTPPSNYGAEAREKWRQKDREAWETERVKQYSLSPLWGRVAAIGMAWESRESGECDSCHLTAPTEIEEYDMLRHFWTQVQEADTLLTWNGHAFDIPFLLTRSAILGVKPTISGRDLLRRYAQHPHLDVKMVVTNWDSRGKGSLGDWLAAFGLEPKQAHGSEVYAMAQRGEWDVIGEYADDDAAKTLQLAERISDAFL